MSPNPEFEILKDKTSFLNDLSSAMAEHPVLVVGGDTRDLVWDGEKWKDPFLAACRRLVAAEDVGVVMTYDPATNRIGFADEVEGIASKKPGMRIQVMKLSLSVKGEADADTNLVAQFLDDGAGKIRMTHSLQMPDRVLFSMLEQLRKKKGPNACVLVDNAHLFVPPHAAGSASPERTSNAAILQQLYLAHEPGEAAPVKWVLIDRENAAADSLKRTVGILNIEATSRRDVKALLNGATEANPGLLNLAAGMPIRDIRRLAAKAPAKDSGAIADHLTRLLPEEKARIISQQTKGAVEYCHHPLSSEQVWLKPKERELWKKIAGAMRSGPSDSLPKGILLVGPPGGGKSARAQMLSSLLGVPFLEAKDFGSQGLAGVKLAKVKAVLEAAIRVKPCVLFLDELSELFPATDGTNRQGGRDNDDAETMGYIKRIIGSPEMQGVVIVGAANHPKRLDTTLMRAGRFGWTIPVLPPESPEEREAVFEAVWKQRKTLRAFGKPRKTLVRFVAAHAPEGSTGADFLDVLDRAVLDHLADPTLDFGELVRKHLASYPFKMARNGKFQEMCHEAKEAATVSFEDEKHEEEPSTTIKAARVVEAAAAETDSMTSALERQTNELMAFQQQLSEQAATLQAERAALDERAKELANTLEVSRKQLKTLLRQAEAEQANSLALREAQKTEGIELARAEKKLQRVRDSLGAVISQAADALSGGRVLMSDYDKKLRKDVALGRVMRELEGLGRSLKVIDGQRDRLMTTAVDKRLRSLPAGFQEIAKDFLVIETTPEGFAVRILIDPLLPKVVVPGMMNAKGLRSLLVTELMAHHQISGFNAGILIRMGTEMEVIEFIDHLYEFCSARVKKPSEVELMSLSGSKYYSPETIDRLLRNLTLADMGLPTEEIIRLRTMIPWELSEEAVRRIERLKKATTNNAGPVILHVPKKCLIDGRERKFNLENAAQAVKGMGETIYMSSKIPEKDKKRTFDLELSAYSPAALKSSSSKPFQDQLSIQKELLGDACEANLDMAIALLIDFLARGSTNDTAQLFNVTGSGGEPMGFGFNDQGARVVFYGNIHRDINGGIGGSYSLI